MWYIYEKRKMKYILLNVLLLIYPVLPKYIEATESFISKEDNFENNVIDFEEDNSLKFKNKYDKVPWHSSNFKKESHRYTLIKENIDLNEQKKKFDKTTAKPDDSNVKNSPFEIIIARKLEDIVKESTPPADYSILPLELLSTTDSTLISIIDSTTEADLTVIPLTFKNRVPNLEIKQTVTLPSTQSWDTSTEYFTTENFNKNTAVGENNETTTTKREITPKSVETTTEFKATEKPVKNVKVEEKGSTNKPLNSTDSKLDTISDDLITSSTTTVKTTESKRNLTQETTTTTTTEAISITNKVATKSIPPKVNTSNRTVADNNTKTSYMTLKGIENDHATKRETNETKPTEIKNLSVTTKDKVSKTNSSETKMQDRGHDGTQESEDLFLELNTEVSEDYYDSKDVLPTTAPKTDAISVIFGLAGSVVESVVESVAERVVPKGIYDLFKRMQKQSEALEAERLRSREENGGLGQFTRGIIKSISTGLSKPLSQLMAGVKDIGSLDTDKGFVSSVASSVATGVTSVATSVADAFKDRVQAIYPGTLWCGDGHSATARSGDLGLFFFTDTCCREHDACKIYINAGDTKYGLTNSGLFTRSHCTCDAQFRECLRKTNSLVSAQIGITYFNVLGPQCFRKAHPIIRCVRRTRITGQKCEEYELDYTKPKMWQWFDNETY